MDFKCPKCGNDTNLTSFIKSRDVIRRRCLVCDYEEDFIPLDRSNGGNGKDTDPDVTNKAPNIH